MTRKVTIIGHAPAPAGGDVPRTPYQPTALPAAPPPPPASPRTPVPASRYQPTAIQPATALPEATSAEPVSIPLSALPGVQRKPMAVSLEDLRRRFPQMPASTLQRVQGVLSGLHPEGMSGAHWVVFGSDAQERLTAFVKQRLQNAQAPELRSTTQHLQRLHTLLADVLDAFQGGFLRRSPVRVWADCQTEVTQLEHLLAACGDALITMMHAATDLQRPARDIGDRIEATALAAEYLVDHLPAETGHLLIARVTSLTASQALHKEQLIHLEQDLSHLQELVTLVQDGILIQLPAVHAQLASLSGSSTRPTETQRFLAIDRLTELLHHIKNGLKKT